MKLILQLLILSLYSCQSPSNRNENSVRSEGTESFRDKFVEKIEPNIKFFLEHAEWKIPGMVVGIVKPSHTEIYSYGKLGDGSVGSEDSIYELGSLTKTFTALLLSKLVVENTIGLNQPLSSCEPDETSAFCFKGKPSTYLDLATHYSALPQNPTNQPLGQSSRLYTAEMLADFLASYSLQRSPGPNQGEFEYSTTGYGVLGAKLAEMDESDFASALTKKVLLPMNLTDTTVKLSDSQKERLVPGFKSNGDTTEYYEDKGGLSGSGALKSSPKDLTTYLQHQLGLVDGSPLKEAVELSHRHYDDRDGHPMSKMALGWERFEANGFTAHWFSGDPPGAKTFMAFHRGAKVGVLIILNAHVSGGDIVQQGLDILTKGITTN